MLTLENKTIQLKKRLLNQDEMGPEEKDTSWNFVTCSRFLFDMLVFMQDLD